MCTSSIIAPEDNISDDDFSTCDAYFEGYKYNSDLEECELHSITGCENPFKYKTKEECERANPDSNKDDFDKKSDLFCVECGDSCVDSDFAARAECLQPTRDFKCGVEDGKCVILNDEIEDEETKDIFEGYEDEEFDKDAGTTPDSAFYFVDKFFDRFGDDLAVREERIAEIKAMIEAGDIESAKKALEDYKKLAKQLGHEVSPEKKEEALRSAAAIRNVMRDIEDKVPEGERDEFVRDIREQENTIATAAQIASKIKELCVQLAELDPLEYSKMCRTDDSAPKWKRDLDADLSADQEKIAREFVDIMKSCFKTSGQNCACDDIPFYDFSVACSKAAPLATACDIEGDEVACDELDNLDMPDLPEWLEPIWQDLEGGMTEAKYDMHMPPECVEAGVTNPKECGKVMIKEHSPLECRAALLDSGCEQEFECRKICDKIMFDLHSPKECIDEGITNPRECKDFMDEFMGPGGPMIGGGPGFGHDCGSIEDPMERLDCYDNKGNQMGEYYGSKDGDMPEGEITWQCKEHRIHWPPDCEKFMREELPNIERQQMEQGDQRREMEQDWRVLEKECALKCEREQKPWDFRNGECICKEGEHYSEGPNKDYNQGPICDDCASKCEDKPGQRLRGTDCGPNGCECYYESDEPQYAEGEGPGEPSDYYGEPPPTESPPPTEPPLTDNGGEPPSDGGDAPITGNAFLDYMYR